MASFLLWHLQNDVTQKVAHSAANIYFAQKRIKQLSEITRCMIRFLCVSTAAVTATKQWIIWELRRTPSENKHTAQYEGSAGAAKKNKIFRYHLFGKSLISLGCTRFGVLAAEVITPSTLETISLGAFRETIWASGAKFKAVHRGGQGPAVVVAAADKLPGGSTGWIVW